MSDRELPSRNINKSRTERLIYTQHSAGRCHSAAKRQNTNDGAKRKSGNESVKTETEQVCVSQRGVTAQNFISVSPPDAHAKERVKSATGEKLQVSRSGKPGSRSLSCLFLRLSHMVTVVTANVLRQTPAGRRDRCSEKCAILPAGGSVCGCGRVPAGGVERCL